jgi:preprotein translocase subunit SecY
VLEKLRIIFTIPELRQKILLTLGLLAIYRVGWQVPLPIIDPKAMAAFGQEAGGFADILKTVAVFSASQLSQATIFGLGIMPYISASIIFQLLGTVWPPLERLTKEGEAGRKKINEYTRYATVLICLVQSWAYVAFLAPGVSYVGDLRFAFMLSPFILSHISGVGIGLDFFGVRADRLGGPYSVTLNFDVLGIVRFVSSRMN